MMGVDYFVYVILGGSILKTRRGNISKTIEDSIVINKRDENNVDILYKISNDNYDHIRQEIIEMPMIFIHSYTN